MSLFIEQTMRRLGDLSGDLSLGLILFRPGSLINFSPEVLARLAQQLRDAVSGLDHPFRLDKAGVPATWALVSDRHQRLVMAKLGPHLKRAFFETLAVVLGRGR